eukprot:UN16703
MKISDLSASTNPKSSLFFEFNLQTSLFKLPSLNCIFKLQSSTSISALLSPHSLNFKLLKLVKKSKIK